jgi:gamma-glutamylcyclotransferase (GGCT)/AIG2-like uncharacterized protein YtfP
MSAPCRLLFVYGTLRRDNSHPMARYLESVSRFLGPATTAGRLYDCGWHPAMVAAAREGERVHGHLVELHDPEAVLTRLDAYETDATAFERRIVEVHDKDGHPMAAWTYLYVGALDNGKLIESGDYGPRPA